MPQIPRPRPELMIIGDSLAQGCRSMTVRADYCAQSWAARIAAAQGWGFTTPDLPRPILFDVENEVRRLHTLSLSMDGLRFEGLESRVRANLRDWLINAVESDQPCFDNLGLAGALIHDLYTRSAASSAAEVASLTGGSENAQLPLEMIGDLHLAINGRFTLNPSHDPGFSQFTPLDWVLERKPKRLLVQIGHNHGLYAIGSQATDTPFTLPHPVHGEYWTQWQVLADRLAQLPAEIEMIAITLLPKIGAVANLQPEVTGWTTGYAPHYEPVFSASPSLLAGEALESIDTQVRAANDRIRATVQQAAAAAGSENRLVFLGMYELFETYDYKNTWEETRIIGIGNDARFDNRYLLSTYQWQFPFGPGLWQLVEGGFQSMDGMHPSGLGYALLAAEVMGKLGLAHDREEMLRQAVAEDTLLSNHPLELRPLIALLALVRDVRRRGELVLERQSFLNDQMHLTDALRMIRSPFTS